MLVPLLRERAKRVYLIGAASDKIAAQIPDSSPLVRSGTLERAVRQAFDSARPGDVVLLAPACASFDQFENYEHRGRVFKDLVQSLIPVATGDRSQWQNGSALINGCLARRCCWLELAC